MYIFLKKFKKNKGFAPVVGGEYLDFITLDDNEKSRKYNFITINEKDNSVFHRQLENRNGRIFMRAKRRSFQI